MKPLATLALLLCASGPGPQGGPELAALTGCYAREMRLSHWTITVVSYRDTAAVAARGFTRWSLGDLEATIAYNLAKSDTLDAAATRRLVVHELTHLVSAEMFWLAARGGLAEAQMGSERMSIVVSTWPLWQERCPT